MIGAVANDEDERDAADHSDGLAVPARLVRQMVVLGYELKSIAKERVAHKDGHHGDDVTDDHGPDQYTGDVLDSLEVRVFHTGDVAVVLLVAHGHVQQGQGLRQDQQPHPQANVAHLADLPELGEPQRRHHGDEAVHAQAGHEVDSGVGVNVEDQARDLAGGLAQRPVEAHGVVGDPERQREREEDVRDDQVEGVQGGGVDLLQVGTDHVERQAVAKQPHEEHHAVDQRHEDPGVLPVVIQSGARQVLRTVAGG